MRDKLPRDLNKFSLAGVAKLITMADDDDELVAQIKENFEHIMSTDEIISYNPDMNNIVKFVGSNGGSPIKMATACGLPFAIFEAWITPKHSDYKPDFAKAVQIAEQLAIVYHEELGDAASLGLIPKHSSPTYQFRMKNQFASRYKEVFTVKTETELQATLDPVKAAEQYKNLLKMANTKKKD